MMVTSGIASIFHEDFIIGTFLGLVTRHIAFSLLSDDIRYSSLFTLEVIAYGFRIVSCIAIFKHRFPFFHAGRILNTISVNSTAVEIHRDNFSC